MRKATGKSSKRIGCRERSSKRSYKRSYEIVLYSSCNRRVHDQLQFFGSCSSQWERVGYVQLPHAVAYIVLSSRDKASYENVSLDPILRHPVAPFVADGQIVLRVGVILFGGLAKP